MSPERHLWQTVVLQAFIDATREDPKVDEDFHAMRDAHVWIRSGPDFHTVCAMAGMDADFLRDAYTSGRINPAALRRVEKRRFQT